MTKHLCANLCLLATTLLIAAVGYPLTVLAVGQSMLPAAANGSIIPGPDGEPVGSALIAQEFKGGGWFHARPSAAGYNASASGGSNFGASNPKLRNRVVEHLKTEYPSKDNVPADAVTTSGSGLDPHITVKTARAQLDRIAAARASKSGRTVEVVREQLDAAIAAAAFRPLGGVIGGEELVNVLELNLSLVEK